MTGFFRESDFVILKRMFYRSKRFQQIISSVLPFALLCSWMACVMVCSELTERGAETEAARSADSGIESVCFESPDILDDCMFTAAPAAFHERQTISFHALTGEKASSLSSKKLPFLKLPAHEPDVNRHSPPKTRSRLFVQFRNFRI